MARGGLSNPEYTVLGIVWRDGPCTTYSVMMRLAGSPSSFFRKRASSTYGIVQKLTKLGLVEPVGDEVGKRGDRPIAVTQDGLTILRKWLSPPVPTVEAAYSNDLIRLRLNFLSALGPDEQVAFVQDALRALGDLEAEQVAAIEQRRDPSQTVAVMGILYETRARIAWLREVQGMLPISQPPRG